MIAQTHFGMCAMQVDLNKTVRQRRYDRFRFRPPPPMLVRKYVDKNDSTAMLAAKRSASVTLAVNLREV